MPQLTPEERNQMHLDMLSWFNGDTEFLEDPAWEPDRELFCAGWKAAHARAKESNATSHQAGASPALVQTLDGPALGAK